MPNVAGYKFDYTDAGIEKAQKLKNLERELRNADDELFRYAGMEGKNMAAATDRVKKKKVQLKKQMDAITKGMTRQPNVEFA